MLVAGLLLITGLKDQAPHSDALPAEKFLMAQTLK